MGRDGAGFSGEDEDQDPQGSADLVVRLEGPGRLAGMLQEREQEAGGGGLLDEQVGPGVGFFGADHQDLLFEIGAGRDGDVGEVGFKHGRRNVVVVADRNIAPKVPLISLIEK